LTQRCLKVKHLAFLEKAHPKNHGEIRHRHSGQGEQTGKAGGERYGRAGRVRTDPRADILTKGIQPLPPAPVMRKLARHDACAQGNGRVSTALPYHIAPASALPRKLTYFPIDLWKVSEPCGVWLAGLAVLAGVSWVWLLVAEFAAGFSWIGPPAAELFAAVAACAVVSARVAAALAASACILAASAVALADCASCNAWSAFAEICFCCSCNFERSPDVAHPITVPERSITKIPKMARFITVHLLSGEIYPSRQDGDGYTPGCGCCTSFCTGSLTGSTKIPLSSRSIFKRLIASSASLTSLKGPAMTR
jgi:hypothetical protein